MDKEKFVHLHNHTKYSIKDSSIKPKALAKRMKENNMSTIAITDHGHMFGVIDFYSELKKDGIKVIPGMETYVAPRHNTLKASKIDDMNFHLVLLAENEVGYKNILKIASDASIEGYYYNARTDKRKLSMWSEGIIALSACLGGEVQKALSGEHKGLNLETYEDRYREGRRIALEYNNIFGQGNFFLELQDHGIDLQLEVNKMLIDLSRDTGIPLVCSNDCHYISESDFEYHDTLLAVRDDKTIDDPTRFRYATDQFYVKTPDEMREIFKEVPEAIENTVKIAERCNVNIEFGVNKLPPFEVPENFNGTNYDFLMHLIELGAAEKNDDISNGIRRERADYEVGVVDRMGYVNYFLIVWDIFRFCKQGTMNYTDPPLEDWKPILTGPGRGSGAGSLMLYYLGITKLDPIEYNLIFERFLDPSRVSMPDIDSDFDCDRRQEVIDYIIKKYGADCVCQIMTMGTYGAKGAVRQAGRTLGYDSSFVDVIAKLIPDDLKITLDEALESGSLKTRYEGEPKTRRLIDTARAMEGLPAFTSTHAAGVLVVDNKGLTSHVPLWSNSGKIVSQYSMDRLEQLGLLKIDILGLTTLGIISETIDMVKKNRGIDIDLDELYKMKDLKPLTLIGEGKTKGIFQLEGSGMTQFMMEYKPQTIEEIIAGISLYRPGPMDDIPRYLENRRNADKIEYPIPAMKNILEETYGVLCYQEQCMRTVVEIAGYDKSDSDGFRKVISKKIKSLLPLHKKWFIYGRKKFDLDEEGREVEYFHEIPGGIAMGHDKVELEKLFDIMEYFASYCFNKSHAGAYAVVAYITAYMLYYYPEEFLASLLNRANTDSKKAEYTVFARDVMGIKIVQTDINTSHTGYYGVDGKILCPLGVKCSKGTSIDFIMNERNVNGEFKTFKDYIDRTWMNVDKATQIAIVSAGAFNSMGLNKASAIYGITELYGKVSSIKTSIKSAKEKGKKYDASSRTDITKVMPDISDLPYIATLNLEKKYLGIYLSGHPLKQYMAAVKNNDNIDLSLFETTVDEETGRYIINSNLKHGKQVRFIGLVSEFRIIRRKRDKAEFGIVSVEGATGNVTFMMGSEMLNTYRDTIKEAGVYKFSGVTSVQYDGSKEPIVFGNAIDEIKKIVMDRVIINITHPKQMSDIIDIMKTDKFIRGKSPLYVRYKDTKVLLKKDLWINSNRVSTLPFDTETDNY